ncbi:MAG: M24 family metallopeptidase [Bacteroidales bacterium]
MKIIFITLLALLSLKSFAQESTNYQNRQDSLLFLYKQSLTVVSTPTDEGKENKHFYYLTGLESDSAMLVLSPKSKEKVVVFTDDADPDYPAKVMPVKRFGNYMKEEIKQYEQLNTANNFHVICSSPEVFKDIVHISNIHKRLVYMRAIKDETEIEALRQACRITAEGLNLAFREVEPGTTEEELIALMEEYFHEQESEGPSFYQAASGPHSVNVHFGATSRKVQEGDLIVFDIGAWYDKYTADISRTVPAGGKFTEAQREIYKIVLKAQKKAIERMKPGVPFLEVQQIAEEKLIEGLYKLGLVTDKNSKWQRKFFIQHGFYHFIGLDIHDVWYDYRETLDDKIYQPGMVMTMEPGVYFPEEMLEERPERIRELVSEKEFKEFAGNIRDVYARYAGMGVRIEDDVLITKEGNEVLTKDVPREIEEIEEMMK